MTDRDLDDDRHYVDCEAGHDRRLFVAMPGYGQVTAGAARGFWRSTRLPDERVYYSYREGSLLASNFNALWCQALNFAHKGKAPDYFAMQHADVEPEDFWLDALIDELEARDLDVLGVVVPIKDARGTTSLALDRPDGDTWRPLCRLTMTEVYRLPETFTSADVGHPLLLNTGLWVCRFDPAWCRKVHFEINDRIVFDVPGDRYRAQTEPEDWYFSRLCHELNLRVGATRKVRLTHRGDAQFANERPWGEAYDSAWVDASPLPEPPPFAMPDIDGWLRPSEGAALADLARDKRVLEIGSYLGLSTVCLARTADSLVSVDPHDGRGTNTPLDTYADFRANLLRHGVAHKVSSFLGPLDACKPDGPFDLIYLDGDHAAESVRADTARALELLAPGGLLAYHDYRSAADPGVSAAVDSLVATGARLVSVVDSLAVVRPPVPAPELLEV